MTKRNLGGVRVLGRLLVGALVVEVVEVVVQGNKITYTNHKRHTQGSFMLGTIINLFASPHNALFHETFKGIKA